MEGKYVKSSLKMEEMRENAGIGYAMIDRLQGGHGMFRDQLGQETLDLMEEYKKRFGCEVPTMYLSATEERDLQAIIRHAIRSDRAIPVRYE